MLTFLPLVGGSVDDILSLAELRGLDVWIGLWVLKGANQFNWRVYQTRLVDKVSLIKVVVYFHALLVSLVECSHIFLDEVPIKNAAEAIIW